LASYVPARGRRTSLEEPSSLQSSSWPVSVCLQSQLSSNPRLSCFSSPCLLHDHLLESPPTAPPTLPRFFRPHDLNLVMLPLKEAVLPPCLDPLPHLCKTPPPPPPHCSQEVPLDSGAWPLLLRQLPPGHFPLTPLRPPTRAQRWLPPPPPLQEEDEACHEESPPPVPPTAPGELPPPPLSPSPPLPMAY